jgi:phosphinothricin acetyltransferase
MVSICPATADDVPGLTAIYNSVISTSTAIFNDTPVPVQDRLAWLETRRSQGYPVLIAKGDGAILGYASFGDFRAWPGYRYTVEHSVHVHEDHRGRGIGRDLVEALFPIARGLGKHVMVAGIDANNEPSLRFHERLGFERTGLLKEVGFKFGRWLDLALMQRWLDAPGSAHLAAGRP